MLQQIQQNLHDADIVCLMSAVDIAWDAIDQQLFQLAVETNKPIFLLLNKVDSIAKEKLLPRLKQMSTDCNDLVARPVSAVSDEGLDALIATVRAELPHHPPYYPEDLPTDQSIRFICAEIVREKTMTALWQEIPYAVAVIIEEFKEPRQVNGTTVIKGVIIVEKQSQKPIVIGKGGQQLKGIGCAAREEIENLVGGPVFLSLFVKVSKDWTKNPQKRREYGYG